MGKLNDLSAAGTAVWLDFVDRKFLNEGGLKKLVEADSLSGVTSNPAIFEKAMGHGDAYDQSLTAYDKDHEGAATIDRYLHQAVEDLGGSFVHPGERWSICRDSEGTPFALEQRQRARPTS